MPDIENELDELEKQEQQAHQHVDLIEQEILTRRYQMDNIRLEIREWEMKLTKAKFNLKKLQSEKRIKTREFWRKK